jgi:hypothetical protein
MVAIGLVEDHVTAVVDLAAVDSAADVMAAVDLAEARVAEMVASEKDHLCTQRSAITAATTVKFLSNQLATNQYIVAIVSRK